MTWSGQSFASSPDVVLATPKGRATATMWTPLRFDGFRFEEPEDGGGRMVDAWKESADKAEHAKAEKRQAKDRSKMDAITADAAAIAGYVLAHPGCTVGKARLHAVGNNGRRWTPARELLGDALVGVGEEGKKSSLRIERGTLPPVVAALLPLGEG